MAARSTKSLESVPRNIPFFCEISLANTPFDTRLPSESTEAFHAFSIYRGLGLTRSLDEVSRRLDAEKRGSGFRLISAKEPGRKPRKSGKIGLWSRKFDWVGRAATWRRSGPERAPMLPQNAFPSLLGEKKRSNPAVALPVL